MTLLQNFFTAPSWHTFPSLASGWAFARDPHTIRTYLWFTGAITVKHFSRCSVFLGCPLYTKRWPLWGAVIRLAAQHVPAGEVMRIIFDDTTKQKAGSPLDGRARYRNGAGAARQAYRTLRGVHVVLGLLPIALTRSPGHRPSLPCGLARSLQPAQAATLDVPYRSSSPWARDILDCVAAQWPTQRLRTVADGGYAPKDLLRPLPAATYAVGRLPVSAKLYTCPAKPTTKRRGAPRHKGALLGSPNALAHTTTGWAPPPTAEGAAVQAGCGL